MSLRLSTPLGYSFTEAVRPSDPSHGGIVVFHQKRLTSTVLRVPTPTTFECLCIRLTDLAGESVVLLTVYRPGSQQVTKLFYDELSAILEVLLVQRSPLVLGGDFNIHVDDQNDPAARRFCDLLASFGMVQHVSEPTHVHGHTLDLVITGDDAQVNNVTVEPPGVLSDHGLLMCHIPYSILGHRRPETIERTVRSWRKVDRAQFKDALKQSPLCSLSFDNATASELFDAYESTLCALADRFAPAHVIKQRRRLLTPWFDSECRKIRRSCRRLERKFHRTGELCDRLEWIKSLRAKHKAFASKERNYWLRKLSEEVKSPRKLWKSISGLIQGPDSSAAGSHSHTPDDFLHAFAKKVEDIRSSTAAAPAVTVRPPAASTLDSFEYCSEETVREAIVNSPTKSCSLDPIPTFFLKEMLDVLLPFLTVLCNKSLLEGIPVSQRRALVTPLLKQSAQNTEELKSYRPVSNLTFMSKVIERLVSRQIQEYITANALMPSKQSAYRKGHSTETALMSLTSDILTAMDQGKVTLLCLLDLSAAFDTVDHDLLFNRLQETFGIRGVPLQWIKKFLTNRTQQVVCNNKRSITFELRCGVPQGSVLGPLLFSLYTAELVDVAARHGMEIHTYADDSQLYISFAASEYGERAAKLSDALSDISNWMSGSHLKLNAEKTQVMLVGTRQQLAKINSRNMDVLGSTVPFLDTVKDLGVMLDKNLSMEGQVSTLTKSCFHQLRRIRGIKRYLPVEGRRTVVQGFVSSRLDYCNGLLYQAGEGLLDRLQRVQNAAARLISDTRKYDHVSPVLQALHWLPIRQRIEFKIATSVYKCLHGLSPIYLSSACIPVSSLSGRQHLRSAAEHKLTVPRARTNVGKRAFSVSGPSVWNSLPRFLRDPGLSLHKFCNELKTVLFDRAYKPT